MHTRTLLFALLLFSQTPVAVAGLPSDSLRYRHYLGTSAFMLGNLFPDPPSFFQLNGGVRLDPRNVLGFEAITWSYGAPLGIPYGDDHGKAEFNYPGRVRSWGLGIAYQHFWWKGLYTSAHALPFFQTYKDTTDRVIQRGFQLYLILRTGYHIEFARGRFFAEPSLAIPYWPVETNMPASFAAKEQQWNNYFLLEPGLHLGVKF